MFLGFCCKVLLRKKGVRVLCVMNADEPCAVRDNTTSKSWRRTGYTRGEQAGILTNYFLSENVESCDAGGVEN